MPKDQKEDIADILQETPKTLVDIEYKGVYFNSSVPKNDNSGKQEVFNITFENKLTLEQETVTFARNKGIKKVFDNQNISVIDCKNTLEATQELKKIFVNYKQNFPELWETEDWFSINNPSVLFKLFDTIQNNYYAGYQNCVGTYYDKGSCSYQWFPLCVDDEMVSLFIPYNLKKAYFEIGNDKSDARLVSAFSNQ